MPENLRYKTVMRRDNIQEFLRLWRIMWERGTPGDGKGYSAKFTVGLIKKAFAYQRDARTDWIVILAGIRLHYSRSYGGTFV